MSYRDTWVTCEECKKQFVFTVEEQRRLAGSGAEIAPPLTCSDCQSSIVLTPGPHEGVVKWYDAGKGYGFIVHQGSSEIFFHRSGMAPESPEHIPDQTRVTYIIEETDRGPQAVEVALMEDVEQAD